MICSLAGDENNYFMKIMIVIGEFFTGLVFDVENPELFIQVSGFLCLIKLF